jgi:transcriptional regulator with XRE-family HTH domain
MIWKILNDRGLNYTVDTLYKLSKYFDVTMEALVVKQKKRPEPRRTYVKKNGQ